MADSICTMTMLHHSIHRIQSRLRIDCMTINDVSTNHGIPNDTRSCIDTDDELIDIKTKCLYYINLGHCYKHLVYIPIAHHMTYFKLYHSDENNEIRITGHTLHSQNSDYTFDYDCRKSYAEAGLYAYEKSKELATLICGSDAEPLLLLANCLYYTHMCLFRKNCYKKARKIAEAVFLNAAEFTNTLSDDTLNLLQYVRDVFMASNDCPESLATLNFDDDNHINFQNNPKVLNAGNEANASNALVLFGDIQTIRLPQRNNKSNEKIVTPTDSGDNSIEILPKFSTVHNDGRYKKQNLIYREIATAYKAKRKLESLSTELANDNKVNEDQSDSDDDLDNYSCENKKFLDNIRIAIRGDSKEETPFLLETLTHALEIYRALDTIFRAYVRGNALPGQLSGGHSVSLGKGLGGQALTFGTFILQGPYISWHGYIRFLLDFNIAKQPSRKSPLGKLFPRVANIEPSIRYSQAPLTMKEATAIFLECSKSVSPSLTVNKYFKEYKTLLEESNKAIKDEVKDLDAWSTVINWCNVGVNQTWEINAGLNFMQFLDCLGKCGCVAYDGNVYKDALPTLKSKIQHFLTAHLGLTDPRKWKQKVLNKNKQIEETIANMKLV